MNTKRAIGVRAWCLASLSLLFIVGVAHAQDSIDSARALYTSAAYEKALAILDRLAPASPAETAQVCRYRALSLLALSRTNEADVALTAMVEADPAMTFTPQEASPSVRARLSAVRQRVLPVVLRHRLAAARTAFLEKRYAEASKGFAALVALLDNPEVRQASDDGDEWRAIAESYVDLVKTAVALADASPATARAARPAAVEEPISMLTEVWSVSAKSETGTAVPPMAIDQSIPRPVGRTSATASRQAVLEVLIDERGRVERATIVRSLNATYDAMLLAAAKDWRYQPATRGGKPVKYRKVLKIAIQR
jgi:TonB family protein